jgi:two-component system phosphate regulon sensor histidine kinase PhoR
LCAAWCDPIFILDLRWVLFVFLLIVLAAVALAIALERWWSRRRHGALPELGEMSSALERAPVGLLILDDFRTCRYANPHARRLLGLTAPPCRLPDVDWVHLLDEDRVAARREMAAAGRYRSVSISADQFVRWWVTAQGDLDLIFLLDATAPQRAEQAARFLLSDLSHELRMPLATLLTHLEVLRLPQIPEETRQQSVHLMQQEAKRMTRLVHHLLELGRLETSTEIERRPVDLRALLEEVTTQVAPQAEERQIALSLQADTPLPFAIGDADRLRQVFLNLLDNAIKYGRSGDRVTVSLRSDRAHEGVVCKVRDTGPGIPAEHLPHVTRRFYRAASEQVGGSGLGLTLAEEILRRHQSKLEIESETEGDATGTCIRFALPALQVEEET